MRHIDVLKPQVVLVIWGCHRQGEFEMPQSLEEPLPCFPFETKAALEPPSEWAEFRLRCPAGRVALPSGDEAVLLTRYNDVKNVLSDNRFGLVIQAGNVARLNDTDSDTASIFDSKMGATILGVGHHEWRRTISKLFTAKRINALQPGIAAMADHLVDEMIAHGPPVDLKAGIGLPLPVWVICDLLGLPGTDRDRLAHWSDVMLSATRYTKAEFNASEDEFGEFMAGHIAAKRAEPGDDLLSALITDINPDGQGWSDDLLTATGMGLLIAGHETTANMIAKMVAMLLVDRKRWEELLADPSLQRTAVEETLRLDANAGLGLMRYFSEDFQVDGTLLPSGTTAICSMAAANRDEGVFEDAAEMNLGRNPNPHITFGAGTHVCPGQHLARAELQAALEALLRKLPSLELAIPEADLRTIEGLAVGGLHELPVRW
jgi:cytochrome P450